MGCRTGSFDDHARDRARVGGLLGDTGGSRGSEEAWRRIAGLFVVLVTAGCFMIQVGGWGCTRPPFAHAKRIPTTRSRK